MSNEFQTLLLQSETSFMQMCQVNNKLLLHIQIKVQSSKNQFTFNWKVQPNVTVLCLQLQLTSLIFSILHLNMIEER